MIQLIFSDNMVVDIHRPINMIYADHIFEEIDFSWIDKYWDGLAPNGIFAVHTDHKLRSDVEIKLRSMPNSVWVNDIITLQRWGGVPKDRFPQKHDYILVYSNGKDWHWDSSKIQVKKQMVNPSFNPSGRTTKTPDACWDDLGNFSTTSGERVKKADGKNIRWQKPLKQLRRLMTPFLREGDFFVDPFVGSGTSLVVADELGCDGVGIEWSDMEYGLAEDRLMGLGIDARDRWGSSDVSVGGLKWNGLGRTNNK